MSRAGRRVGILGHTGRPGVRKAAQRLAAHLESQGHEVAFDDQIASEMKSSGMSLAKLAAWCDVLVSLGGDGTALKGARALVGREAALLPVNLGGLGFLTAAEEPELESAMRMALGGRWKTEARRPIEAAVTRRDRRVHRALAMNDAVIKTAGGYAALHLRLQALGSDLGYLVADGIIAASAAGSTGYSLSAGGPVVSRRLEALVVTPVCAHTLGSRSLVLADDDRLKLRVIGTSDQAILIMDGQEPLELAAGDQVSIALAARAVRIFENPDKPLASALQAKLGWQGSERRSLR
ncbi:MAG: NAD(+)/NADH kinase [Candidatus Eisenbacteria bacterium]|uniref:NAD kinase n=1 Tax=Eiseniibacteriota bacterium TaxID=2212470 RepID=A0A538U0Y8_UNCEI|nr:MAG: NAD(+)/NADH kinase [Candidatus Eisenbacteria bacterium]